jgi:hypothetical protein
MLLGVRGGGSSYGWSSVVLIFRVVGAIPTAKLSFVLSARLPTSFRGMGRERRFLGGHEEGDGRPRRSQFIPPPPASRLN